MSIRKKKTNPQTLMLQPEVGIARVHAAASAGVPTTSTSAPQAPAPATSSVSVAKPLGGRILPSRSAPQATFPHPAAAPVRCNLKRSHGTCGPIRVLNSTVRPDKSVASRSPPRLASQKGPGHHRVHLSRFGPGRQAFPRAVLRVHSLLHLPVPPSKASDRPGL